MSLVTQSSHIVQSRVTSPVSQRVQLPSQSSQSVRVPALSVVEPGAPAGSELNMEAPSQAWDAFDEFDL